ncbi:caspase domain-containing protein [Hyphomicrobium sp. CS1GBMeth3]|uniref:caspase family protein n=1 Tax=Hyphomicrobium sp. CS1GBMeth3 TaxID=1892845 RepID=UPI0015C55BF3|nr:caspase domain-containing protein [Hyphomicrobium sp. CS1GBMeth3]
MAPPAEAAKRVALVIGNASYTNTAALANPKNDATDFGAAIKSFGFEVIEGLDLDKAGMDRKLREFADALEDASVAVLFYAGHGLQVDGINYLVPVDAMLSKKAALEFEMVRLDSIQRHMESEERTSILFFDACRDNPLARNLASSMGTRSVREGAGLAQQEAGAGTLISYSTAPGRTALDGSGRNSPFTGALVKQMLSSKDHLAEMLYEVRNSVMKSTNGSQVPWDVSALTRRFYFKEPAQPPMVAALPPDVGMPALPSAPAATDAALPRKSTDPDFPPLEPLVPLAPGIIDNGDMAVSGFSGTKLAMDRLKPGVYPIDTTVIDPDGASVRVFNTAMLQPKDAAVLKPAIKLEVKAGDIGQVFSLAYGTPETAGDRPNLFAAATSRFGLQIVGPDADADGMPDRLKQGAPGAVFMEGQFGTKLGGGPGAIWKIDGASGVPSLFANVMLDDVQNSGAGLGGLAFDPQSRNLYVSDLDTGMIHRFDPAGTELGRFDHGVDGRKALQLPPIPDDGQRLDISMPRFKPEEPATWGLTPLARQVHGLAIFGRRLYYAVGEGAEIWSVGLDTTGGFASGARREIRLADVKSAEAATALPVTDILFDSGGRMTVAQRGRLRNPFDYAQFAEPDRARVLRYLPAKSGTDGWAPEPEEYAVGFGGDYRQATGGISLAFGRKEDGSIDLSKCEVNLVATGDALRDNPSFAPRLRAGGPSIVHGLQIVPAGRLRPANAPPLESLFVDFDGVYEDASLRGQVGDVEVFRDCTGTYFPPIVAGMSPDQTDKPPGALADLAPPSESLEGTGGALSPATVVSPSGIRIDKKPAGADCTDERGCTFEIAVTNTLSTPINGPIVIDEIVTVGNADLSHAVMTSDNEPTWICTRAPPFFCTHPEPILPGVRVSLTVHVKLPAAGEARELTNCASLHTPPDNRQPPTTATIGGLSLKPTMQQAVCSESGGCALNVALTNTTGKPFRGPATVIALISGHRGKIAAGLDNNATLEQLPTAPWTCTRVGLPWRCVNNTLALAPGTSTELKLMFKPGTLGPEDRFLGTSTALELPNGNVSATSDFVPASFLLQRSDARAFEIQRSRSVGSKNGQACGTIMLGPQVSRLPDAPRDPFSLRVIKSGVGTCARGGTCEFRLTLLNDGTVDHNAPVTFTDAMSDEVPSMAIVSINPPLPCAEQPQSIPFTCTTPGRYPLATGRHENFTIVTRLPTAGLPDTLKNCMAITKPWNAAPEFASLSKPPVDAESGSYECHEVAVGPEALSCFGGMVLTAGDLCQCPEGTAWNGRTCAAAPTAHCPDGWTGTYPYCCQAGQEYRDGACKEAVAMPDVCPPDRPNGDYPNCCPARTYYSNGSCRYRKTTESKPKPTKRRETTTTNQGPTIMLNPYKDCYGKPIPIWKKCKY